MKSLVKTGECRCEREETRSGQSRQGPTSATPVSTVSTTVPLHNCNYSLLSGFGTPSLKHFLEHLCHVLLQRLWSMPFLQHQLPKGFSQCQQGLTITTSH